MWTLNWNSTVWNLLFTFYLWLLLDIDIISSGTNFRLNMSASQLCWSSDILRQSYFIDKYCSLLVALACTSMKILCSDIVWILFEIPLEQNYKIIVIVYLECLWLGVSWVLTIRERVCVCCVLDVCVFEIDWSSNLYQLIPRITIFCIKRTTTGMIVN